MPLLHHLQPPACGGVIWLERFSPYFTDGSLGLSTSARSCYGYIYPDTIDHSKIAYYFDYVAPVTASPEAHALMGAGGGRLATRLGTR